jgi:anti-sigma B factor antagonist
LTTPAQFDVRVETASPGVTIVHVVGELDLATCSVVEEAIAATPPSSSRVIVDLTGCTFLDSSGLRVLMRARREVEERGAGLELVAADPTIVRVLDIANVVPVLTIYPTLDAAL